MAKEIGVRMSAYVMVQDKDIILDSLDLKGTGEEFQLYANAAKDRIANVLDAAGISCQFYEAEDTGEGTAAFSRDTAPSVGHRGIRWFPVEKSGRRKRNFLTNYNEVLKDG